jgi:hypothetical protein
MSSTGRDTKLFVNEVDGDFICPICLGAMSDPVDTACAHSFCRTCIVAQIERCVIVVCICCGVVVD